jgi:hypothetical protein
MASRSKGKTASSSQSAAFVTGSGFGSSSFGFGSIESVSLESLSPENALIFKKIVKKDTITKIKGLDELRKVIETHGSTDHENLDAVLNKWVAEFPRLVEDSAPKVRLLTVKLMGLIGSTFKSRLMKDLKELIPAWMCATFDPRKEIATAALEALRSTIPQSKHNDTINFVRVGILDYVEAHLTALFDVSGALLSKDATAEEDSESFGRIVGTNVQLLSHLASTLSNEDFAKIASKFADLMDLHIWKLHKARDAKIRAEFYGLLAALLRHSSFTAQHLEATAKIILTSISDSDPAAQPKAWGALVALFGTHPIFSLPWFNVKKLFIPPLVQAIKSPQATESTYHALLPMLSTIPEAHFSQLLLDTLFSELWRALKHESTVQVVVSTYFDCLIYTIAKLSPEIQKTILDAHFMPIFAGYFNYAKEIAENITHAIALFISRLESKKEVDRNVVTSIWKKLQDLTQIHFLLGNAQELTPSPNEKIATSVFAEKLKNLIVQLEATRSEAKRQSAYEGLVNLFDRLLEPTLLRLMETGYTDQLRCISELGPVWRSIDALTFAQERKKAEAAEYLANQSGAPSFITDLVSGPLRSSLRTSSDNSEWQYLLKGLIQQRDMKSIKNFMSHEVHDISFWSCSDLAQLALNQASYDALSLVDETDSKDVCILPFLVKFLSQEVLGQLIPILLESANKDAKEWTIPFISNITQSIAAICEAATSPEVDPTVLLNTLFGWALAPNELISSSLQTRLHEDAMKALETALPALIKTRDNLNFDQLVFLVRSHLAKVMKSADSNNGHDTLVQGMANVVGRLCNGLSQTPAYRPTSLRILSRLLLTEDEWVFVTTALKSQRDIDVYAHNPMGMGETIERPAASSATIVESSAALLNYSIQILSRVDQLELIASDADLTTFPTSATQFIDPRCDMRIIAEITHLLVCESILLSAPSAVKESSASQTLRTVVSSLSELIDSRLLPSLLLRTTSGTFQILNHILSNYAHSSLATLQIGRIFSFLASSPTISESDKTFIFSNVWSQVMNVTAKQASLIAGLKSQKWASFLPPDFLKTVLLKSLSELYQLKPAPDGALAPVTSAFAYQFLVTSVLIPIAPEAVEKRKVFEIFLFAAKYSFSIMDEKECSADAAAFLVGLSHFVSNVILNTQFDWKLSEANYSLIFDLSERMLAYSDLNSPQKLNPVGYNAMILVDALCEHMFVDVKMTNADWAHFINDAIGPLCNAWKELSHTLNLWPSSHLRRWARVMRFTNSSSVLRLEGDAITQLYDIIRFSTNLHTQYATYGMLLSVIKDHNSNTFTKSISASSAQHDHSHDASSSISDLKDDTLDSKVLPDALQHIVLDVAAGYSEPLDLDELDLDSVEDEHVYLLSASVCTSTLLGWRLILEHLNSKDEKEKSDVSTWIRQSQLLHLLVPLLCHLIDLERPPKIAFDVSLERHLQSTAFGKREDSVSSEKSNLTAVHNTLGEMAFYVLKELFEQVPVLMRTWWQQSDSQLRAQVELFASKFISPQLVSKELSRVSSWKPANPMLDEFSMKATSVGEVVASYRKDEVEISMTLKLASSHPLKPVTVNMSHKAVSEALWRKWLLSMRSLLLTRDGSLLDAVLLWRDYLDRHFDGVECCPICYAIFHISNYSIPDLACKTCKNKFHKACLYKWFNTSHHNECPLCKTPFN